MLVMKRELFLRFILINTPNRVGLMQALWNSICLKANIYLDVYYDLLCDWWSDMTPEKYLTLLLTIGVLGYLSMRNGLKRI